MFLDKPSLIELVLASISFQQQKKLGASPRASMSASVPGAERTATWWGDDRQDCQEDSNRRTVEPPTVRCAFLHACHNGVDAAL
jgi:hypothetical protein